jgi:thiamine-phosphate pyrophosphorylase
MNLNTSYYENFYFFTNRLTNENKKNIIKFKNLSVICINNELTDNYEEFIDILKFCKNKKIKIYYKDDVRKALKYNLNGVYLSGSNKKFLFLINNLNKKHNFKIIGGAHNQNEYFFKKKQMCEDVLLSPLFKNGKYNQSQILNICKFNLMSKEWRCNLFALGGVNSSNLKKVSMTKSQGAGFISFMSDFKIKKPVYFFKNRRALNKI